MTDQYGGPPRQVLGNEVTDVVREALERLFANLDSQANGVAAVASLCQVGDEVLLHFSSSLASAHLWLVQGFLQLVAAAAR